MPRPLRHGLLDAILLGLSLAAPATALAAPVGAPAGFDVAQRAVVLFAHGEGAQVYQCEPGADGRLAWTFREPIATLIADGKTVGRHYAGPTWELNDGGVVKGALLASQPGAGANDIPLLKLAAAEHHGSGALAGANLVLRLNTRGGALKGDCATPGELHAEPYSADYVFLH
jgi:Protein of unknown function (DUF3455)